MSVRIRIQADSPASIVLLAILYTCIQVNFGSDELAGYRSIKSDIPFGKVTKGGKGFPPAC